MAALRMAMNVRVGSQSTLRVNTSSVRSQRSVTARVTRVPRVMASVDKEAVLNDVRAIIAEQLGTDLDKVAANSKFVDLGADSLDTVEIMMALEEKFDITLDEEGAEKISTVGEAADMISAQMV